MRHERDESIVAMVESCFPFALTLDRNLRLQEVGRSLAKILPAEIFGQSLDQFARLVRPRCSSDFDSIRACANQMVVLKLLPLELSFRGQIIAVSDHLVFLVSPVFDRNSQLVEAGLQMTDFALHDLTLENLFLKQDLQTQLQDHRLMVGQLKEAMEERDRLAQLEQNLAHDLAGAGDLLIRFEENGRILDFRSVQPTVLGLPAHDFIDRFVEEHFCKVSQTAKLHAKDITPSQPMRLELTLDDGSVFETRLARTLQGHFLLLGNNVTERKQMEKALKHKSLHDPLTDLANRELFMQSANEAARQRRGCAVVFIDIDNFKFFNDTYGHHVGDFLIRRAAHQIRRCIRDDDLAARLGGDEFGVILRSNHETASVMDVAARLLSKLCEECVFEQRVYRLTASIGIAIDTGDESAESLVSRADIAMYESKAQGKNQATLFQPEMFERFVHRSGRQDRIREALLNEEFQPHYQTIVDLSSHTTVGVEALARWHHPDRGIVPPAEFIEIAEESDLICELGMRILRTGCEDIQTTNESGGRNLNVNVNFSARQFREPHLADRVHEVLCKTQLPPERLCIEITESLVLEELTLASQILANLREVGVQIALDDFGTGYSSLSYLERLPVDKIKLDRCFVRNVLTDVRRRALIKGVLDLADCMNLAVIAEGIENLEQANTLRDMGCRYGQGFLFSRAMKLPILIERLNHELEDAPHDGLQAASH